MTGEAAVLPSIEPSLETWPRPPTLDLGEAAHIVHAFPSFSVGGSQVRFAALAGSLGPRFRHTVLSLRGDFAAAELVPPGARVTYAAPFPRASSMLGRLQLYRDRLAELRPEVLLTYNWGAVEVVLANLSLRLSHVHLEDGFGPEEASRQLRRRAWTRRVLLRRSEVIVPSRTLLAIALRQWGLSAARVHHIPNGISAQTRFSTRLDSLGLELPPDLPRILWVGALRPEKNPLRILHAFAPLKGRAVLLLIGDGPERGRLLQEIERLDLEGHARLLGSRHDARDLMLQADVLALSSDTEQMPYVVLEAMDAGLPVASTDVGDVRLMLSPENRDFVVPPAPEALSGALRTLVEDPGLRKGIGRANQTRRRRIYTLPAMVKAHGDVLAAMVHRARIRAR